MNWIRIDKGMPADPKLDAMAERLKVRTAEAMGLVVSVLCQFPDHCRSGDIGALPDKTLEKWAGWHGKAGAFAAVFRSVFCTEAGVVSGWDKHNGSPQRQAEYDRKRKEEERKRSKEAPAEEDFSLGSPTDSPTDSPEEVLRYETRRDETTAVAVPRDSEKQLAMSPPRRTPRGHGGLNPIATLLPSGIVQ